jgi:site-specific DNA-methyltransferase (adenine-specific)
MVTASAPSSSGSPAAEDSFHDVFSRRVQDRVIRGNCIEIMPKLPPVDFIFADPPFNIGKKYAGDDTRDHMTQTEYREFTDQWLDAAWKICKGVMCIHGPDKLVDLVILWMFKNNLAQNRVAWVNWMYNFGQCISSNWVDARCHCLIFARNPNKYVWNDDAVRVESLRASEYGDNRVFDTEKGGMRVPGTVWGTQMDGKFWGRVTGNSKERRKNHDNQLPEKYVGRLIQAYTNPGSTVLDPFGGSGTTIVVAEALKRSPITIERSAIYCESIRERLMNGSVQFG